MATSRARTFASTTRRRAMIVRYVSAVASVVCRRTWSALASATRFASAACAVRAQRAGAYSGNRTSRLALS
ncbi:MAG: hypothetical protein DMF94_12195 [Acidobacteria bacterium]|nr:MAG: hypothetical protein DMF94_12195 [Acidobacteriota bacterium]